MAIGEGFKEDLKDHIISSFGSFTDLINESKTILTGNGVSWINDAWTLVEGICDILNPFCQSIIALCLLIELAQTVMKVDVLKWENGLKVCIKMVLSKVCITVAPTFLKACYQQACEWIGSIGASTGALSNIITELQQSATDYLASVDGLGSILGLYISVSFVVIAIKICGLLMKVIAFGRMFEILVYIAISPLPCAFFPLGDGTGGGISRITQKYFKSFIAVCLQGVMMILCIQIYNSIIASVLIANTDAANAAAANVSELCYTMLMGAIVLVMSVARCGTWAKSIIDAM